MKYNSPKCYLNAWKSLENERKNGNALHLTIFINHVFIHAFQTHTCAHARSSHYELKLKIISHSFFRFTSPMVLFMRPIQAARISYTRPHMIYFSFVCIVPSTKQKISKIFEYKPNFMRFIIDMIISTLVLDRTFRNAGISWSKTFYGYECPENNGAHERFFIVYCFLSSSYINQTRTWLTDKASFIPTNKLRAKVDHFSKLQPRLNPLKPAGENWRVQPDGWMNLPCI